MKTFFAILIILNINFLLSGQKLCFNGTDFVLNSKEYSISEIKNVLVLDSINQVLFQRIESINNAKQVWGALTLMSGLSTGLSFAGLIYFTKKESYVSVVGGIVTVSALIVSIPITIISATGLIVTSYKRRNRINTFLDRYNKNLMSETKTKLKVDLKLNIANVGLIFTF